MSSNKSLLGRYSPQQNYYEENKKASCKNKESIISTVNTGFGESNTLVKECHKPKLLTPLYKENYLGDFISSTEKQIVRDNLGIYSKDETDTALAKLISQNNLVSKSEVLIMLDNLDVVKSTLKKYVDYQIPNNLFN